MTKHFLRKPKKEPEQKHPQPSEAGLERRLTLLEDSLNFAVKNSEERIKQLCELSYRVKLIEDKIMSLPSTEQVERIVNGPEPWELK